MEPQTQVLSPRQLAQAIGVSESSVKRWVDDGKIEAHKTEGGHRRILRSEAIRYLRSTGTPLLRPDVLGLPHREDTAALPADQVKELLLGHLLAGREGGAETLLVSRFVGGASVAELADGPIRGALVEIGQLWHSREDGIAVEHRAMEVVLHTVHSLRELLPDPRPTAPVAIGGAPDVYRLPTLLASMCLLEEGFRAVNLGPQTPLPVLADQAERDRARLVWLSVTESDRVDARELGRLADRCAERSATLLLGGREHQAIPLARRSTVVEGESLAELSAFARGMLRS